MTTIAFANGVMAGDGRLSTDMGAIITDTYVKVRDCGRYVVGLCGEASEFNKAFNWFKAGADLKSKPEGVWGGLVWDKQNATLMLLEDEAEDYIYISSTECHAVGSGGELARVAMICGKTPEEALRITMDYNKDTGGRITAVVCDTQLKPVKKITKTP